MSAAAAAALAAAEQQLAAGRPAACLAVLAALAPKQREALPARRLQALCHIQLAGDAKHAASAGSAWWKVGWLPGFRKGPGGCFGMHGEAQGAGVECRCQPPH